MGLKLLSSSTYDAIPARVHPHDNQSKTFPNPDPSNFTIIRSSQVGEFLLLEVMYHDCVNYEGRKILLYQGVDLVRLLHLNKNTLDPHFSNNKQKYSPIARFVPTEAGWKMGLSLMNNYLEGIL